MKTIRLKKQKNITEYVIALLLVLTAFVYTGCSKTDDGTEEEANVGYWQVSWELNGGAWPATGDNHATRVVKDGMLAEPAAPAKAGNTLEGWYKEPALTNKVSFPYDVSPETGNITLYAKWTSGGSADPEGYKMFTSISEMSSWVSNQPANTVETAYKVGLKGINLDTGNNWGNLALAVKSRSQYLNVYLQGCTGAAIPDGYYEREVLGTTVKYTYYGVFIGFNNLVAVTLPGGLKTIGKYAFYECENLASVALPEGLTEIHEEAFRGCFRLGDFNFPQSLTSIEDYVFYNCNKLASFTAPANLKKIGEGAFKFCGFTAITIPAFLATAEWGSYVFSDCSKLTSAVIEEGITKLPWGIFSGCALLTSVTLPQDMEILPGNIFYGCASLESITLPQNLKIMEQAVFEGCALKSITLPEGLTTIGISAFSRCRLTALTLPESLISIGWGAFRYCSLTSVTIPAKVVSIGDYSFESCSSLSSVVLLPQTPPVLGSMLAGGASAFISGTASPSAGKIKVPPASLNAYLNADVWNKFSTGVIVANTN